MRQDRLGLVEQQASYSHGNQQRRQDPPHRAWLSSLMASLPGWLSRVCQPEYSTFPEDGQTACAGGGACIPIFASDVIDAPVRTADAPPQGVYNVAGGSQVTVNQVLHTEEELVGRARPYRTRGLPGR